MRRSLSPSPLTKPLFVVVGWHVEFSSSSPTPSPSYACYARAGYASRRKIELKKIILKEIIIQLLNEHWGSLEDSENRELQLNCPCQRGLVNKPAEHSVVWNSTCYGLIILSGNWRWPWRPVIPSQFQRDRIKSFDELYCYRVPRVSL